MNNNNPLVTVRMPAYNHERYIEKAILSIVNQTFQDFELIVINDGSTDRTPEILDRLSEEYGFRVIHQENAGLTKTLNRLISLAKGQFITGCASDDFWPETRLEEQVACFERYPDADLVHGNFTTVDGDSQILPNGGLKGQPIDGSSEFPHFVRRKRSYLTCTIMVRTEAFHEVGLYDETIAVEDFDWMLRATRLLNIKHSDQSWTFYRRHGNNWGMTSSGAAKMADSSYQEAKKLSLYWGTIFLFYKAPKLLHQEIQAGRKRRFLIVALIPVLLFNVDFLMQLKLEVMKRMKRKY
jgi:glycosyltransferase involved in cell wall biosynthesis